MKKILIEEVQNGFIMTIEEDNAVENYVFHNIKEVIEKINVRKDVTL